MKKMNAATGRAVSMSLMLAGALIAGSGLYFYAALGTDRVKAYLAGGGRLALLPDFVVLLTIVCLGLVAVGVVLWKRLRDDRRLADLDEAYREAYDYFSETLEVSGLKRREKADLQEEVLNLFLEARSRGRSVEEVIGKDRKAFADDMIAASGGGSAWLYDLMGGVQFFVFYMLAGTLLYSIKTGEGFFKVELPYTLIAFFLLSAFVAIPLTYRIKRTGGTGSTGRAGAGNFRILISTVALFAGFLLAVEGLERLASESIWALRFLEGRVAVIGSAWHLAAGLFLFAVAARLKKRKRFRD